MIEVAAFRGYLESRGITVPVVSGLEPLENPDRVVFATPEGGDGDVRERTFERVDMQVRCRGARNNPGDSVRLATLVDQALMDVSYPLSIDGRHVTRIQYAGGMPALSGRDSSRRHFVSATYVIEIARNLP